MPSPTQQAQIQSFVFLAKLYSLGGGAVWKCRSPWARRTLGGLARGPSCSLKLVALVHSCFHLLIAAKQTGRALHHLSGS